VNQRQAKSNIILTIAAAWVALLLFCFAAGPATALALAQDLPATSRPAGTADPAPPPVAPPTTSEQQTNPPQPDGEGHSVQTVVALILLLTIPVALMILMTRLQRKRLEASKEAAKREKEQARISGPGQGT